MQTRKEPISIQFENKPLTPTHISGTMETPISSNQAKNMMSNTVENKERLLPILKSYTGPPQGIDGKIFRGNVEMGHSNDLVIS